MLSTAPMVRATRRRPCPICGKFDYCGLAADGSVAICMRIGEGSKRASKNGGYVHVLRADAGIATRPTRRRAVVVHPEPTPTDLGPLAAGYVAAVDRGRLQRFADSLGVTVEGLDRLRVGWAADHRAWAFPMHDADGLVRGIRLRTETGQKFSVTGGKEGIFLPAGLTYITPLMICEGPTDTAAGLDLGFDTIGRPCCTGGVDRICEIVLRNRPPEVVIFGDPDAPGRRGAEALASSLLMYTPAVRVVYPPAEVKDLRVWKRNGATRADLLTVIAAADVRRLVVKGSIRHGQ